MSEQSRPVIDGRFEILSQLGEGGMGTVYRALHRDMDRQVALKLLKASFIHAPEQQLRFRNEAQVISTLKHPNIVSVYSIGISENGAPYIAMELLEGRPLSELVGQSHFKSYKDVLPIFIQACDALEHAHEKGIIHRDIKPSNLMVVNETGEGPQLKVVDFGIAKALEGDSITRTSVVIGSAFYLSPGQCEGRHPSVQSDIYALGCTMFEVLAGKPPFVGDFYIETMQKIRSEPAPSVKQINPHADLPDSLEAVIACCLSKDTDTRYATVADLRQDLRNILVGNQPQHITQQSMGRQAAFSRLPLRTIFSATAITLLLLAALSLAYMYFTDRNQPGEPEYDAASQRSRISRELHAIWELNSSRDFKGLDDRALAAWRNAKRLKDPIMEGRAAVASSITAMRITKHPDVMDKYLRERSLVPLEESYRHLKQACDNRTAPVMAMAYDQLLETGIEYSNALGLAGRRQERHRVMLESIDAYQKGSRDNDTRIRLRYTLRQWIEEAIRAKDESGSLYLAKIWCQLDKEVNNAPDLKEFIERARSAGQKKLAARLLEMEKQKR